MGDGVITLSWTRNPPMDAIEMIARHAESAGAPIPSELMLLQAEADIAEGVAGLMPMCVAWDGSKPIGFALPYLGYSSFRAQPIAHMGNLYVRPEYRRNGTGAMILKEVIRQVKAEGCQRLVFDVRDANAPIIRLYERHGGTRARGRSMYELAL